MEADVFDERLAARLRELLDSDVSFSERRMFGGICFLVDGAMCCGVLKEDLIVRAGPEEGPRALTRPHTRAFDFTGKPSAGMIYVAPEGTKTKAQLWRWVRLGLAFVAAARKVRKPTARRSRR